MVRESYVFTTTIERVRVNATCTFYAPIAFVNAGTDNERYKRHGNLSTINWTTLFPLGLAVPMMKVTYGRSHTMKLS
jgi:hypothetical protein